MAKSKWEQVKEKLILVEAWARDGLIDEQIFNNLRISKDTFYKYKNKYVEFSDALKKGKEVVDVEGENALFKKATGFTTMVKKHYKLKHVTYEDGKRVEEKEELKEVEEELYTPPETMAQIYWLNNRKSAQWRNKQQDVSNESDSGNMQELIQAILKSKGDAK